MGDQLELQEAPRPTVVARALFGGNDADDLALRFLAFHEAKPGVYAEIVDVLRRWRRARPELERVEVNLAVAWLRGSELHDSVERSDHYLIDNNHRAFYARLIRACEPDLAPLIVTRKRRSKPVEQPGGSPV